MLCIVFWYLVIAITLVAEDGRASDQLTKAVFKRRRQGLVPKVQDLREGEWVERRGPSSQATNITGRGSAGHLALAYTGTAERLLSNKKGNTEHDNAHGIRIARRISLKEVEAWRTNPCICS